MNDSSYLMGLPDSIKVKIAAAEIVNHRPSSIGAYTQIAGHPKPIGEFIKDCEEVYKYLKHDGWEGQ